MPNSPRPDSPWLADRRKSWARMIRRVYEVDPLLCRCGKRMRVVGFITQPPVILKILHHIGGRFDPLNDDLIGFQASRPTPEKRKCLL